MPHLALFLLGSPRVELDEAPVHIGRSKAIALLAYLALEGGRPRRDALAVLLWPEYDHSNARAELRRALSTLNRALGSGFLHADRETAGLDPGAQLSLDVNKFRRLLALCRHHEHADDQACPDCLDWLTNAVALYRDDFMVGFTLPDAPEFDNWQRFQTSNLQAEFGSVLARLSDCLAAQGEHDDAIAHARRWLALDQAYEPAHRQLMALHAQAGQPTAALRQYRDCARVLEEELGISPSAETITLYERIRAGSDVAPRREASPSPTPPILHNLPPQPTPIIGREPELAELDELIADPEVRLIAIVGPGGIGKTRLALAAAERQVASPLFPDGVHFVPLARLSAADQIAPSLAEALHFRLRSEPGSPTARQQVLDYLREKRSLLILDNLEHLIGPTRALTPSSPVRSKSDAPAVKATSPPAPEKPEACGVEEASSSSGQFVSPSAADGLHPAARETGRKTGGAEFVADILHTAPGVQVLVTSRERLPLREAQAYPLHGLEYPGSESDAATPQCAAAQLFMQAARRVQPAFCLSADDVLSLARICRSLVGMPLAIELAAAWVDVLSLADIAAEISNNLGFLEAEWQDVPRRHRSVRAVFDTSWNRLGRAQQEAFARLCVFRGGFTLSAARAVASVDLRMLAQLVDRSLLTFSRAQERYDVHELLRQYGADQLGMDPGLETAVNDRHSAFYCTALGRWGDHRNQGGVRKETVDFDVDWANVRLAWEWAVRQERVDRIDRALDGLWHFFLAHSRIQEAESMYHLAIDGLTVGSRQPSPDGQRVLALALLYRSEANAEMGHWERARSMIQQSQRLLDDAALSESDTRRERAWLHVMMGREAVPDWENARRHYKQALRLQRELGYAGQMAYRYADIAWMYMGSANYGRARQTLEESLALFSVVENQLGVMTSLNILGHVAHIESDYDEAKRRHGEALSVARAQGDQEGSAQTLVFMGELASFLGEYQAADGYLRESATIRRETGNRVGLSDCLTDLAAALWFRGEFDRAYAQLEESLSIAEQTNVPWVLGFALAFHAWLDAASGRYEAARIYAEKSIALYQVGANSYPFAVSQFVLGCVALAKEDYAAALKPLRNAITAFQGMLMAYATQECTAFSHAALGRAEYGLGNRVEAERRLLEALEIVVEIRAFIPLLHLMPVIPVLLAEAQDPRLKERAVELYTMATGHPFVARAQLFEDIAGRYIRAATVDLPADVVAAAQARGRALDWWATAETLLEELRALGWADG
jgi:DNA-binding SARP family transcriptional activator/predicted ATPase